MKPLRLVIAAAARRDLDELWDYIAEHNVSAADRAVASVERTARLLCHQPEMGLPRPDIIDGTLAFPVGHHLLFYIHDDAVLAIIRVLDGRRDPENMT